jgi:putative salt-induced outer membrane protein YdiY
MRVITVLVFAIAALFGRTASAQAPADPPKIWTITTSAGLALTSGNTETSTVNAAYDIVYDPDTRNTVKSDALFLRGKTDGEVTASRLGVNIRDEFRFSTRAFVFGQNQYLRDEFKDIDYLIAPSGGIGYKLFDTNVTKLDVDGGIGGVWEKNTNAEVRSSGAITAAEKLQQTLTANTTLNQSITALWKTNDFEDSLYTFGLGIAVAMSERTQLKAEVLDVYKNRPPLPEIKKNDVAVLMAIVYKM